MADKANNLPGSQDLYDFWDVFKKRQSPHDRYVNYYDTRPGVSSKKKLSQSIDSNLIRRMAFSALDREQDPKEVLAMGIQESGMGNWDNPDNPLHIYRPTHMNKSRSKFVSDESTAFSKPKDEIDAALNVKWYNENIRYPKDKDKALQAYQGLGWLVQGKDKWDGPTQDASVTRPYVKRIREVMKTFDDNPHIKMMLDRIKEDHTTEQALQAMGVLP